MKIRNIIAVGLSLFALASCSKDSQPVNVKDMKDAETEYLDESFCSGYESGWR